MKPAASNFTESGTPRPVATICRASRRHSGSMRQISLAPITGKYNKPSGPTSMALGDGTFSSRIRGGPPARSNSISRPPSRHSPMKSLSPMEGDAVGGRDVVAQDAGGARGVAEADPAVHHLRRDEVAARVERHVVGRDDVAALGADGLDLARGQVERADLAAGHLGDVDAAVRAGAKAVGAEQPTRRGEPAQLPALREGRRGRGRVARLSASHRRTLARAH